MPFNTPISTGNKGTPTLNVVIIDDNPSDRDLMRRHLLRDTEYRFAVREADTGSTGAALCQENPQPDCVLLDMHLPDMHGLDVIRQLKRNNEQLPIPVIVLTGAQTSVLEGNTALELGAQDYLGKSFITADNLSRALINAVERFRLTQRLQQSEHSFRSLFEAACVANAESEFHTGQFLRVNQRFCELVGYSAEELRGMTFLQITHPDDRERNFAARSVVMRGEKPSFEIEKRYIRKDGEVIWVHVSSALVRGGPGEVGTFLGSIFDITEKKRSEEKIRLATERFEVALKDSSIAVSNQDLALRYTWTYNFAFGYDPALVMGRRDADIFERPQDAIRTESIKLEVIRTGLSHRQEIEIQGQGTIHYYDLQVDPTRDAAGQITGITCAAIDITERRIARYKLAQTTAQLRLFAEHAPAAIAMLDTKMRYITASQRWLSNFGLAGQNLLGKSHYDIFPNLPQRWKDIHRRCLAGAVERADEDFFENACGPHWSRWEIRPWHDASGSVGGIIIFSEDITQRKRDEHALLESEGRFRLATAATHAMVFDLDVASQRLNSLEGAQELLGYKMSEADTTLDWWDTRIEQEDLPLRRAAFQKMLEHPQSHSLEYRVRHQDGHLLWVADNAIPVLDEAGHLVRIVGTIADITQRKQAELALREVNRNKDAFIATLSHELRNPLAPVANAAKVMSDLAIEDPKLIWCREVIDRQVGQMARLLDDLLDVSRINSNKLTLQREQLELATVIEHAIEMARPLIDGAGHELSVALPDRPVRLYGDRVRLAQIFSNLLTNAAKYTKPKGRIRVSAHTDAEEVQVDVQDNGIGFAAEDMPRLFRMFGQVDSAIDRAQGGLGIGLSLVKGLVELHGGRISARSDGPAKGSCFSVALPLSTQAAPPSPVPRKKKAKSAIARRILVVDDIRDNADSLAFVLQLAGHEVETARDGREAVRKAQEYRPDVILLDIGLPELNGYDVCRAIRAQLWGHKILIVAVTGWGQDEDRRRAHEAGFDAHLTKPLNYAALMELLTASETAQPKSVSP